MSDAPITVSHLPTVTRAAQHAGRGAATAVGVTSRSMPQVVELPPIGQDQRGALVALVRVCKETPAKG